MIKLKNILLESGFKNLRFKFNDKSNFYKLSGELNKFNFRNSNNGNPPRGNEVGTYKPDDHWNTIDIIGNNPKSIKLALKIAKKLNITYNVEYTKPIDYMVHNHGGYLD